VIILFVVLYDNIADISIDIMIKELGLLGLSDYVSKVFKHHDFLGSLYHSNFHTIPIQLQSKHFFVKIIICQEFAQLHGACV
jgi:hypothetical protein